MKSKETWKSCKNKEEVETGTSRESSKISYIQHMSKKRYFGNKNQEFSGYKKGTKILNSSMLQLLKEGVAT